MITLRQLRYFHALEEALHFGRAAEACSVSQPALSMQIKDLESELGVTLIERRKNGVQLTSEGREIARRAADILLSTRDLQNFASGKGGPLGRILSLGVIPTIAPYFLPLALPDLQQRYPELDLTLHEAQTDHLLEKLGEGALDVALLALPAGDNSFISLPLFADHFLLAMPASAPSPDSVLVDDLRVEKLILLEEGHCLRDQALSLCGAVGRGAMSRFGATSLTTVLQLVANGYGATLLPEMAVTVELRPDTPLTLRRLVPEPSRTIGLLWRASAPRQERFKHLGDVFLDVWRRSNPG